MIKIIKRTIIFFSVVLLAACNSGTDDLDNRQGSQNPFGAQIIVVDSNDNTVYGNLSDLIEVVINVNEQLTPDGTQVDFEFSSTDLPINKRGCVIGEDSSISDGRAVLDLLTGLYIDDTPSEPDPPAAVTVGVTLTRAGGQQESRFFPIAINPVGLIAPNDTEITTSLPGDPNIFITLQFQTFGIPVGTIVEFEVSDPGLGDVEEAMVPVMGTKAEGQAIVQYTSENNTGGTQVVTATIVLPDPVTMDPDCPSIPESERTLQAVMVIDQSVPEEEEMEPEPEVEMICDDMMDNDGDGFTDCSDTDCDGVVIGDMGQVCQTGEETSCSDSFDNDDDGFEDCEDADCDGVDTPGGTCEFVTEFTCDDGFDNDGDGDVDCADSDCTGDPACP